MLLDGINHIAILTADTDRLHAFYRRVFDAEVAHDQQVESGTRMSVVDVGPHTELNVFEIAGNDQATQRGRMFQRGGIDHMGLQAASLQAFETVRDRLMEVGATDGFVTDFGPVLSVFFTDPDGLEGEVCVANPDARPGVMNPPGTPSARFAS